MRHIYQRYQTDCFPTCIAMVAGISHREAMRLVHPIRLKGWGYGTYDHVAVRVLRNLGLKVRKRYIKDFTKLKQVAILQITHDKGEHVAVWDPLKKKVLEPSRKGQGLSNSWYKERLNYVYLIT